LSETGVPFSGSCSNASRTQPVSGMQRSTQRRAAAREGADVLIAYLNEDDDAKETRRLVEDAGRKAVLLAGDVGSATHCRTIIDKAMKELRGIDILVNNAAHQATFKSIEDISDEEWEHTFKVNLHAMFYLTKAAVPHMKEGSAIINTASINADTPNPTLLAYATTKGAIQNFTAGLAQLLAEKGIRVNAVAPGPIWTPLIPSTMPEEAVENFGKNVPMKRPGQPAELATAYVMLADPLSSYVSGATIAVPCRLPVKEGHSLPPGLAVLRGFAWQFEPASRSPVRKCPPLDSDSCEVLLSCTDIFVHLSDAVGWGEPVPYDRSRIEKHSTANRGQ
jgi:NAD(P)-dependent dehydrogenase (short-subunit alcohol dehydrogenase family)